MLQVYLVRHGETVWNAERRIQGQSDSPLTEKGEQQAWQVGERVKHLGITHIIASDLGRTRRTAEIIADACGCSVTLDPRLRELNMGVLEKRPLDGLTAEEEQWRATLVNGTEGGRIPEGESMTEMATRMHAALNACLDLLLPEAVHCSSVTVWRWGRWSARFSVCPPMRNVVCVCVTAHSHVLIISRAPGWQKAGLSRRRGIFPIWMRLHSTSFNADLLKRLPSR